MKIMKPSHLVLMWAVATAGSGCGASDGAPSVPAGPPGAEPRSPELTRRLQTALAARGEGYVPRTHHLHDDGRPKYTNRLILETSPYLLQHAHNPVDWYPWGDEAFEAARRLNRPVLLSIGYSTCHWCHVMEEESFEDEEIAAYLNAHYIAIKVDREERPDVDSIYMSAVQLMTGRGGWPMTTWLDHERRPFYGGTYFPARDGDRGARKGFLTLLRELRALYDDEPDTVASRTAQIVERIRASLRPDPAGELPGEAVIDAAVAGYKKRFDAEEGGVGRAPKFPSSLPVRLLLRRYRDGADAQALDMALLTLDKMAAGGMYDQVGGGFHRYSVDRRWRVPHFEKMLYDNALLAVAYLEAYQLTGKPDYARVAREILDYVAREMTDPGGGFYSATDADSAGPEGEREEGRFFTWTPAEIDAVLGEDGALLRRYYGVTEQGDYEGRNVLHVAASVLGIARETKLEPAAVEAKLAEARRRLYEHRARRPPPLRDDKQLAAWNGLMIGAFARGGFVLDEPGYVERAARAADFVLDDMIEDGRLHRSYMDGRARHRGYLDDYAFLIAGLLDLYEAAGDPERLRRALALQAVLERHYRDPAGGYFLTADDHETLLAREKPTYDGAEPSGNSVALLNLLRLHELTGDDRHRAAADALLRGFGSSLRRNPQGLAEMLLALDFRLSAPKEIVLVVPEKREQAGPFLDLLRRELFPYQVLIVVAEGEQLGRLAELTPLVEGKTAREKRATAYVCQAGVCRRPTTDVAVFESLVDDGKPTVVSP